ALGLANAGLRKHADDRLQEQAARLQAVKAALARLEALGHEQSLPDAVLEPMRARHSERLRHIKHRGDGDEAHLKLLEAHDALEFALIEVERQEINELYRTGELKDEVRRRIERELDLREAHLTNVRGDSGD